jgi:hypothetical protein
MRRLDLAALCLLAGACGSPAHFTEKVYVNPEYPYGVHYLGARADAPMGEAWRLDNYVFKGSVPVRLKSGTGYEVQRSYDTNDDGEVDETETEPFFDLLFDHKRIDARMWVRTVPLSTHDAEKQLAVFAERYVRAASGAGSVLVRFGSEDGDVAVVEKRMALRVLSSAECAVSGRPAHRVDFEVANVDELQLSKDARWSRGRLVIVQTPYFKTLDESATTPARYPVLMLVGASSSPGEFGAIEGDFGTLLDRLVLREYGQTRSVPRKSTCNDVSAGSAAGGAAVTPPASPDAEPPVVAPQAAP